MDQNTDHNAAAGARRAAVERPLVSIIVPCFNTAPYLDDCLGSLLAQTHRQIEVIAIDDGSTDDTGAILDAWHERDARVRVARRPNRGLGAARNAALSLATGSYLTFVDSDDMLPHDALERMVTTIERTGSDFVSGVAYRFDETSSWRASLYRRGFREDLERTHVFERPSLLRDSIVCSKLFRKSFWDEHGFTFPQGVLFEDIELVTQAQCLARSVDLLAEPTYLWRSRPDGDLSITQDRTKPGSVAQRFAALTRTDHFVRHHAPANIWRRHSLKVLSVDVPLYLHLFDSADDRYATEYVDAVASFLATASPVAIAEQGHLRRRLIEMITNRDVPSVHAMSRLMGPRKTRTVRSRLSGVRLLGWRDRLWLVRVALATVRDRARRLVTSTLPRLRRD